MTAEISILEADEVAELQRDACRPVIIDAVRRGAAGETLADGGKLAGALQTFSMTTGDLRKLIVDYQNAKAGGYFTDDYAIETKRMDDAVLALNAKIDRAATRLHEMKTTRHGLAADARGRRTNKAVYARKLSVECMRGILDAN